MNIQNFQGYCLIYRNEQPAPEGLSTGPAGRPGPWQTLIPCVIYPTLEDLIAAVPDFDKRKHIIGQVIVHLLSERVEIVSVKLEGE